MFSFHPVIIKWTLEAKWTMTTGKTFNVTKTIETKEPTDVQLVEFDNVWLLYSWGQFSIRPGLSYLADRSISGFFLLSPAFELYVISGNSPVQKCPFSR